MKPALRKEIIEQLAMALVAGIFLLGIFLCADETEGKALSTYLWQSLAGLGLMGGAIWLGREFIRKGIVQDPEDDSEEL